jgi:flagellar biosynthetic protein FliR
MRIELSTAWLCGYLLVLARVAGIFALAPVPQFRGAAGVVRMALAAAIAALLTPVWITAGVPLPAVGPGWLLAGALGAESLFGISVGLVLSLLLETFMLAAQFLGLQAGYGYASTIDPASQADAGVLLVLAQLAAWMLFVVFGLEQDVLRALALSIERFPPGTFWVTEGARAAVLAFGKSAVDAAFRLALPVIALLVLIDLAFAAFGKLHAQLQLLSLAFPVKMLAALIMLAAVFDAWRNLYGRLGVQAVSALARLAEGG